MEEHSGLFKSNRDRTELGHYRFLVIARLYFSMPVYNLLFKAELENIKKLKFPHNHAWLMDFQSGFSDETREGVRVTAAEEVEMPNSRSTANVCITFKDTGKSAASINVTTVKGVTRNTYLAQDSCSFVSIAAFDCRGAIPVKWSPTGFYFADNFKIDLNNGEWFDVDPDTCESVSITDVQWKLERQPST
jgi:Eukaryotic protein of unknown function (DUF866)